ncbi:hypothetical protein EXE53_19205 [Halorubrum sp. SD626R]|uniref:hypothetical protein n=1 Tax=Halorubrum sp. SD626R TaxID=1419722 RepID=UPI0010F6F402|nr:hypothetical protein [Halorubrum sp. SD626R]TKX78814.1 hypothetical protein EXE53_19205 [Halorubrum sp. SD626R]
MSKTESQTTSGETKTTNSDAEWTPERWGYGWGEGTQQGRDDGDEPAPEWWTDAYEMRMRFGIPEFDPDAFEYDVYPDVLIHEKPAERTLSAGGTDWLKVGERGCGKSTDNLHWSCRLMDENDEKVIWRGSPNRSEWTPFADWATVWLPRHSGVNARWVFEDDTREPESIGSLDDIARSVRYYDDVPDLVDQLGDHPAGTFNVVYPDASFSGCSEISRKSSRVSGTLPFTPEWIAGEDDEPTPLTHWWFAFMLARIEFANSNGWWSWMFDEAADLVPPSVEQDEHKTHSKLMLFRNLMQDSRRSRFSVYLTIHRESQINWRVREEHMWRVDMPDSTPNPRRKSKRSIPHGFSTVPMISDIMSDRQIGQALMFNERNFSLYQWSDIKADDDGEGVLKLGLGEPTSAPSIDEAQRDLSEVSE